MIFYLHESLSNGRYCFCSYILERSCGKICSKEVSIPCSGAQKRHISTSFTVRFFLLRCGGVFKWSEDGDDKDGASKVNLRSFSLHRYYSNSLASLNVGEVPLELNHKVRNRKKILRCLFFVLHRTWSWVFSRRSRAVTGTKSSQKCTAPAKLVCLLNQFFFFTFSLLSPSSDLKVPILSTSSY